MLDVAALVRDPFSATLAVAGMAKVRVGVGVPVTVRLKVFDDICAVPGVWSVTVTVKLVAASAAVGVPVIWPVSSSSARPAGRPGDTA